MIGSNAQWPGRGNDISSKSVDMSRGMSRGMSRDMSRELSQNTAPRGIELRAGVKLRRCSVLCAWTFLRVPG